VDWCELAGVFEREEMPPKVGTAAEELLPLPVLEALELLEPEVKSSGLFWCSRTPGPYRGRNGFVGNHTVFDRKMKGYRRGSAATSHIHPCATPPLSCSTKFVTFLKQNIRFYGVEFR